MLTIHHLGISQSERIVWLCEELNLPYQLVRHERVPPYLTAPESYGSLHPFGTAPVITDDAVTLAESSAIVEYLCARYGAGQLTIDPADAAFAEYLFWFHFANGSLMPSMMIQSVVTALGKCSGSVPSSFLARTDRAFALTESRLGSADYFAGSQFTAADIMMSFPLTTMRKFVAYDLTPYPNIRAYLKRIGQRPAYQKAMRIAEPDSEPLLS